MSHSIAEKLGEYDVASRLEAPGREIYTAGRDTGSYVLTLFEGPAPMRRSLEEEVRRAMLIEHPSVMVPVDTFAHDDRHVLVLPAVEGISLLRAMRLWQAEEDTLSDGAIGYLGSVMMKALSLAHEAKDMAGRRKALVHAELAPHQILLPWDEAPRVLGIGMTAVFEAAADNGRRPPWVTPFMAPEVRAGKPVTVRSNAYSAALMLWSLYSREMPPEEGLPASLAEIRPELPHAISSRIDQTLSERAYTRTGCSLLAKVLASRVKDADPEALKSALLALKGMVPRATPVPTESIPPCSFERVIGGASLDDGPALMAAPTPPGGIRAISTMRSPAAEGSAAKSDKPTRRRTRILSSAALRGEAPPESSLQISAHDPLDKRPTKPTLAAVAIAAEVADSTDGDRAGVSAPMRTKSKPALSLADGSLPPRRSTLPSLASFDDAAGGIAFESGAEVEAAGSKSASSTTPGLGQDERGPKKTRQTKMMGAIVDVVKAVDAATITHAASSAPIEETLDWELEPLVSDEDSMPGADAEAVPSEGVSDEALAQDESAAADGEVPEAAPSDEGIHSDEAIAAAVENASKRQADELTAASDIDAVETGAGAVESGAVEAGAFESSLAEVGEEEGREVADSAAPSEPGLASLAGASALEAPLPAVVSDAPDSEMAGKPSGLGKWLAAALVVAGVVGGGVWWSGRGASASAPAEPSASVANNHAAAVSAKVGATDPSGVAAVASVVPSTSAGVAPSAAASASAAVKVVAGMPAAELPADKGYLLVTTPYHGDTHVYANGKPLGKSGEALLATCNKPLWIRIGTMPQTRWYGQGRAVVVPCRDTKKTMFNTAPQAGAGADGDIYQ